MKIKALKGQKVEELSMIEVAHAILEQKAEDLTFTELLSEVQGYLGKSDEEIKKTIARFYAELNTDGSFIPLGENKWGLRSWYALDSIDEETISLEYFDEDELEDDLHDDLIEDDTEEAPSSSPKVKVDEIVYDENTDDEAAEVEAYDEELEEVDLDAEIPEDVVVIHNLDDETDDEVEDENEK